MLLGFTEDSFRWLIPGLLRTLWSALHVLDFLWALRLLSHRNAWRWQTTSNADELHGMAAGGAGKSLSGESLPGCLHEGGTRPQAGSRRIPSAGRSNQIPVYWFDKMHGGGGWRRAGVMQTYTRPITYEPNQNLVINELPYLPVMIAWQGNEELLHSRCDWFRVLLYRYMS